MKVQESSFYQEALRFIGYGAQMGWHERNAGNISLKLSIDEVYNARESFKTSPWVELAVSVPEMASEYVFTTVSGSYFIDMSHNPQKKFCICEISEDGKYYRVVWGGQKPTSELCGHLLSLAELKKRGTGRAVYHCHPANIVALSYLYPQNEKTLSEALWESETECAFVFPQGVGVVGFQIPGSIELATATAEKIQKYDAVLWSFHGIFASGDSIASAFGLAHAIEKAAEIKLKILSTGRTVYNRITPKQQKQTAEFYGYQLNDFKEE